MGQICLHIKKEIEKASLHNFSSFINSNNSYLTLLLGLLRLSVIEPTYGLKIFKFNSIFIKNKGVFV